MSGNSNVIFYLAKRALPSSPEIIAAVLAEVKKSDRVLTEEDVVRVVRQCEGALVG